MAKKQETKEALQKKITVLEESNKTLTDNMVFHKKQFAKAFGWYKRDRSFGAFNPDDGEVRNPTWGEIYIKLGELLYIEGMQRKEYSMEDLMSRISRVENIINQGEEELH